MATFSSNYFVNLLKAGPNFNVTGSSAQGAQDNVLSNGSIWEDGTTTLSVTGGGAGGTYSGFTQIQGFDFVLVSTGGNSFTAYGIVDDPDSFSVPSGNAFNDGAVNTDPVDPTTICLTAGTLIGTPEGERAVEDLEVGDEILTWDGRVVTVRFIASNVVPAITLRTNPSVVPVRIRAGALGPAQPHTDLLVSRQHKIMLSGERAALLFDTPRVLVSAESLVNDSTITFADEETVTYYVIVCDRHEVIRANGAPADTLYLSPGAVRDPAQREEIETIFPGLLDSPRGAYGPPAARILADTEVRSLLERPRG